VLSLKEKKILMRVVQLIIVAAIIIPLVVVAFSKDEKPSSDFVPVKQKQEWKASIIETVNDVKEQFQYDMDGFAFALLDVDMDSTPELVVASPGGSSGSLALQGYDIITGEYELFFSAGNLLGEWDGSWCVYKDIKENKYEPIGIGSSKGGFELRFDNVLRIVPAVQGDCAYDTEAFLRKEHSLQIDYKQEDFPETHDEVEYFVNGEKVTFDEYHTQYDTFILNNIRIPETEIKFVFSRDLACEKDDEGFAEEVAEALLATGQEFIVVK
jgi:hypothetical protein